MRKLFVLVAALGLLAAACGGDSGGGSCESVADEAMDAFQSVISEFDDMTLDELSALGDEDPPAIADMEQKLDGLQEQANDLGCSDETMEELIMARVPNLKASGFFGELMIDGLSEGGLFE